MPTLLEATQDARLTHAAVRMYAYLVEWLATTRTPPTWEDFEAACCMGRRTVGRSLQQLEATGYLGITRKWVSGCHAKYEGNRYEVL